MLLVQVLPSFENSRDERLDQPILFEIEDNANILHLCQKLEPITAIPLYEIKIEKLGKGIDNNELISDVLDVGTSEDLGTDAELSVLHGSSFVAKIKFYKQAHKNGEPLSHEYYGLPQEMIKRNGTLLTGRSAQVADPEPISSFEEEEPTCCEIRSANLL
nr:uncharacterized protein LOC108010441 [Drosophila suzukii]